VDALEKNDMSKVSSLFQQLLDALVPYIIMASPPEDDSPSCKAPLFSSDVASTHPP